MDLFWPIKSIGQKSVYVGVGLWGKAFFKLATDTHRENAGKSRQEVGGASPSHGKG